MKFYLRTVEQLRKDVRNGGYEMNWHDRRNKDEHHARLVRSWLVTHLEEARKDAAYLEEGATVDQLTKLIDRAQERTDDRQEDMWSTL